MEYIKLNNGIKMPVLGLGTFLLTPDEAENSVLLALKNGYRLIDTANAYVNEKAVGRGIKKSLVSRNEIFLETKLWPAFYEDDDAVDKTLKRLDTEYIDLMILHQPAGNYLAGYRQLEKGYKEGKLKAIGISNFNKDEVKEILDNCEIKPALIQVEAHPYYPQTQFNQFLKENNIVLQSWYPLGGKGNQSILTEEYIQQLGKKYNKSSAQIILKWHIQKGYIVIPGSRSEQHIQENIEVFDFELTKEEMSKIDKLDKNTPIYIRTDAALKGYANWRPDVDGQK
ncbi:MAG: aldo/keto reductase [Anaeroplasmataceae bacterium]|nr:aldo/keto reductase [Anaeroplasmataceae bacterium]